MIYGSVRNRTFLNVVELTVRLPAALRAPAGATS
jgi:hypothetical protein